MWLLESWFGNVCHGSCQSDQSRRVTLFHTEVRAGKTKWCFVSKTFIRAVKAVMSENITAFFFFLSPRCLHYCKTKLMKLQSIQLSSYTKNPKEGNFVFSDSRARIKFSFSKAQWEEQLRGGKKAHLPEPFTEAVVKSSGASCLCDLSSLERARGVRAWLMLAFSQWSVNSTRSLNDVSTGSKGNRWLRAQEAERLPEQPLARHW